MKGNLMKIIPLGMRLPLLVITLGLIAGLPALYFFGWQIMLLIAGIFFSIFYVLAMGNFFGWLYQHHGGHTGPGDDE